uniref:Uncharacterized protein n=1 Tax=Meleagris gallopavo TaxID=9103 RepID=A0A803XM72_MELGA
LHFPLSFENFSFLWLIKMKWSEVWEPTLSKVLKNNHCALLSLPEFADKMTISIGTASQTPLPLISQAPSALAILPNHRSITFALQLPLKSCSCSQGALPLNLGDLPETLACEKASALFVHKPDKALPTKATRILCFPLSYMFHCFVSLSLCVP